MRIYVWKMGPEVRQKTKACPVVRRDISLTPVRPILDAFHPLEQLLRERCYFISSVDDEGIDQ